MRPTILIVDDARWNRTLLRAMLESEYEIREAADALEALSIVANHPVDLVLLDVMMPGLSGHEACRRIKAAAGALFLPVLLVTALASQEDRNIGLACGADDFLTKPVDRRELLLRTAAFLRMRDQERTIRDQMIQLRALASLKDDLVSLLVHDLRNPLAGIQLLADAARERGGCGASDADAIARAAGRMRATLDDMLKVRLLEDSALPLRRAPHRLSELMAEGVSGIEAAARGRRVGIRIAVDDDVAVPCDLPLVGRAIENLVGNAIRYTPVGGDIDVRAGRVDDTAEIQIGDRGPGMPSGTQAALFDKFGALRAGATDGRQGFGLGLYMARLVLEAHGGSVVAAGREGGGTVFRVSLPGVCA